MILRRVKFQLSIFIDKLLFLLPIESIPLYDDKSFKRFINICDRHDVLWQSATARGVRKHTMYHKCDNLSVLLSPYLCFISFLYLDLYVLRDDAFIS